MDGSDAPWRRVSHGSTRFSSDARTLQPQDGATGPASLGPRVASIASRLQPALPREPEDARLTGMTRSLGRRLMGLNVTAVPETAAPTVKTQASRQPRRVAAAPLSAPETRVA